MMFNKMLSRSRSKMNIFLVLALLFIFVLTFPVVASAQPVILYTDILSGPNTGGENNNGTYLSIFGKGFGQSEDLGSTTRVYINGTEVATYKYLGPSNGRNDIQQLSVQPGQTVSSGAIKVVVSGQESNTDKTFTVRDGDIYFVDNIVGSQSTGEIGNINRPFRYVQQTWDRSDFSPGDFIVMRGTGSDWDDGTYFLDTDKGGSSGQPVTLMGYPGESVNVRQRSSTKTFRPNSGSQYIDFVGFNVVKWEERNSTSGDNVAFTLNGNGHHRLVNLDISGSQGGYLGAINTATDTKILGCNLHVNGITGNSSWNNSHAIYAHATILEIGWTVISDQSGGRAIQMRSPNAAAVNADIHDNIIYNIDRSGIIIGEGWSTGIRIYNNIFYNNSVISQGSIRVSSTSVSQNAEIFNNIFYNNNSYPITIEASLANPPIFKNNIFYETSGTYCSSNCSSAIWSHNLWYGSGTAPSWDSNAVNGDPKFENASNKDFHLKSDSPAIDTGVDIASVAKDHDSNPRPMDGDDDGTATTDIGAFEYTGTYIPPTADIIAPAPPSGLIIVLN